MKNKEIQAYGAELRTTAGAAISRACASFVTMC